MGSKRFYFNADQELWFDLLPTSGARLRFLGALEPQLARLLTHQR